MMFMFVPLFLLALQDVQASLEFQMTALKASGTPCCVDTLRSGVCKALYSRDHDRFNKQCRTNADFSFTQCCHSCHFNPEYFTAKGSAVPKDIYREDAENLLLRYNPSVCFDRHGSSFCEAFVTRTASWSRTQISCQHTAFAFRVCRKTCGFCTSNKPATVIYDPIIAKNPKVCTKLY